MLVFSKISQKPGIPYLVLALLVVLVFSSTLFFEFVWDDKLFLVGNAAYQSVSLNQLLFESINGKEYLPLKDLTYVLEYKIWGWNPLGFHLTNLLLYVLNVWAVYGLTLILGRVLFTPLNDTCSNRTLLIALVTATAFAVHPLHSEVVSFIHCRNVLLSGLFFFLSIIFFLKYLQNDRTTDNVISLVLFFFALLSKATVIMLPLILLVLVYFRKGHRLGNYLAVTPFMLLAVVFFYIFKSQADANSVSPEQFLMAFGGGSLIPQKIVTALQVPFFYAAKLIAPVNLSTEYASNLSGELVSIKIISSFVALCAFLLVGYYFKDRFPQGLFALLWFLICLIPVSNIFLTNPVVADRYAYLSSYAFALVLGVLCQPIHEKFGLKSTLIFFVLILSVLSWLTYERNSVWRSNVTVFTDMTSSQSNRGKAYSSLGHYHLGIQQYPKALDYFRKAKEISPEFSELEYYQAFIAFIENRPGEALKLIEVALQSHVLIKDAHYWGLKGEIHEYQGEFAQAIRSYQKAIDSTYIEVELREYASNKLDDIKRKLAPEMENSRQEVLAHPGDLNRKAKFALMLQEAGFDTEAIALYQDLLNLGGPKWQIHYNLGLLYKRAGQLEKSLNHYLLSSSLNETSGMINNELGVLMKTLGRYDEAAIHFNRAIVLEPGSVKPRVNLAKLYFQLGQKESARELFEYIVSSFPEYEALAQRYLMRIPN